MAFALCRCTRSIFLHRVVIGLKMDRRDRQSLGGVQRGSPQRQDAGVLNAEILVVRYGENIPENPLILFRIQGDEVCRKYL